MMGQPVGMNRMANDVNPENCMEYRKYREMGDEIRAALQQAMEIARGGGETPAPMQETPAPMAAAGPWTCPSCGGQNNGKFCEYCGSPRP